MKKKVIISLLVVTILSATLLIITIYKNSTGGVSDVDFDKYVKESNVKVEGIIPGSYKETDSLIMVIYKINEEKQFRVIYDKETRKMSSIIVGSDVE